MKHKIQGINSLRISCNYCFNTKYYPELRKKRKGINAFMVLSNTLSGPSCWSRGRWELCVPTPCGGFSLASGTKKSIMCLCWGNWLLPWVLSFPLGTTWREQCTAVFDFEILNTSPERLIFHPKAVHLFGQSLLLLSMCCCFCLVCIVFPSKMKY